MLPWLLMMARVPLCWGHQAADVVARLTRAARCGLTTTDHSDGRFQLGPLSTGVQVVQAVRGRDGPAFPPFHPSVAFVHGLVIVIRHPVKTKSLGPVEPVSYALVELTLVLFHRQYVIGSAIHNLLSNLSLAAHGPIGNKSHGHDAAIQFQQVQHLGDGGDLIGFLRSFDLAQGQGVLRRPGADQSLPRT